jgi:hypothetical protein
MRKIPALVVFAFSVILSPGNLHAQTGGNAGYAFLSLTNSPRTAAMGGQFLAFYDEDPFVGARNPAAINSGMHQQLGFGFIDYFSDIKGGSIAWGYHHEKAGSYVAGIEFLDYGEFTHTDQTGQILGTFSARDMAFSLGWGRPLAENYGIGASLKVIHSALESYNSTGLALDLGAGWHNDDNSTSAVLMLSNIGAQLSTYVPGGEREPLPTKLRFGISRKPEHIPFRISLLVDDLQKWDLAYDDPTNPILTIDPLTGEPLERSKVGSIADNTLRHLVLGGEFTPFNGFALRVGYNYRRRQEMKVSSRTATVGFSWGMGLKISKFRFDYARMNYHLAGSYNMFSVRTDIGSFSKMRPSVPAF